MTDVRKLKVKLFADGADLAVIAEMARNPMIKGFTTNPTLMRKAGVIDYRAFAQEALRIIGDKPISFEVFSDEFLEMKAQALEIASWGGANIYVKIPVSNTRGEFSGELVRDLTEAGVQLNVTAIMTPAQVADVLKCMAPAVRGYVSVFAGRIADTGRDPCPLMGECVKLLAAYPSVELIWASPRELLNIFQADAVGCPIITATRDVLSKLPLVGKDLGEFSLDTVRMFRKDALAAGYAIDVSPLGSPQELVMVK
ncbi:MAG: transaldolase [Candidatus Lindowbacteria bacterium RIFCSPLOWO2_12_FULL_62_27]|nr:MAG: transaldolase [Candidatus Lindowbacteria bacterium RIFCSPLOWO2_12_FULL_62_27]OGH63569.1 MAG: transaldolase [Candidatus Lindowbacteria bacterium RIFCSPLOWO2_02_FULL_62_12]